MVYFTCNICGTENSVPDEQKHREMLACTGCQSCARFRGLVWAAQKSVLGSSGPLNAQGERKSIKGLGFSDSESYAGELARIFSYRNTFYHDQEPRLDLMSAESVAKYEPQDFVICSDVLEHVPPPVITAFENLRRLVKPGGVLILSVPYLEGYETIEHYPHLRNGWTQVEITPGRWVLINSPLGRKSVEVFDDLTFHGGPGEVLEMRLYGEGDLLARLKYAGFESIEVLEPNIPEIGYVWDYRCERDDWNGRRGKSCVMVCR